MVRGWDVGLGLRGRYREDRFCEKYIEQEVEDTNTMY
jgi:hypothetical protein